MDRDTLFPKLLADLYDNTGRPEDWPALLESLVAYVGGRAARLFVGTLDHPRHVTSAAVVGTDPAFLRLYVDRFAATDPRIGPLLGRIGQVTRGEEDLDAAAFDRTALVRECLDPGGVRHACGAMLAAGGPAKAWVAVLRPRAEGPFGEAAMRRFGRVLPHFQRSLDLHARLGAQVATAGALEALLGRMTDGILLVDRHGRVILANPAAEAILARADGLLASQGRLAARRPADAARLVRAIGNAAGAPSGAEPLAGDATVLVHRNEAAKPYRVLVCPLGRAHPAFGLGPSVEVALIVTDPEPVRRGGAEVFGTAFGLTPAEARLALRLAEGGTLAEAAALSGVSINTVRSQVRRLFEKTGARRQADLVRVLQASRSIALDP